MVVYSIKDIERLSGVKAHTLRIWEKRYNIIIPKRTLNNVRYYDEDDLKVILNIALLYRNGMKISKIALMSADDIQREVTNITAIDKSLEDQLDALTISLIELDEEKFSALLDQNIKQRGFEDTLYEEIYPLLDKMAMMWVTGSIKSIHEKFVVSLVRRKCLVQIDQMKPTRKERFLIFMPEGHKGELSLLFLHYTLKKNGFRVLDGGSNVSFDQLIEVQSTNPSQFLLAKYRKRVNDEAATNYAQMLRNRFVNSTIFLSGISSDIPALKALEPNVFAFRSSREITSYLGNI